MKSRSKTIAKLVINVSGSTQRPAAGSKDKLRVRPKYHRNVDK